MAKREREREEGGGQERDIEVRPRISFSPGLQFEDVVAFVPPVYTRYAKGVRRGPEGGQREGGRGRGEEQGVYTCSREVHGQHALARVDVYVRDVDISTPVCVPATYLGRGASFFFLLATTNVPDLSSLAPGMRTRRSEIRKSREGSSRVRDVNSKFVPVIPVDATGSGIFGAFATSGGTKTYEARYKK